MNQRLLGALKVFYALSARRLIFESSTTPRQVRSGLRGVHGRAARANGCPRRAWWARGQPRSHSRGCCASGRFRRRFGFFMALWMMCSVRVFQCGLVGVYTDFVSIVRLIKRPRGAPGPRKQLSVRFELSVRVVTPSSNSFKNQWKSMKISIFGPKIIKRPLRIKRPRGAPGSRKQLSVRGR